MLPPSRARSPLRTADAESGLRADVMPSWMDMLLERMNEPIADSAGEWPATSHPLLSACAHSGACP